MMASGDLGGEIMDFLKVKFVRDPIHGEIELYPIESLVADTRAMQRLRKLSQLSGAVYTYPGATHTRFAHALGAMHLSGLYARRLYPGDDRVFTLARIAGLVHDIGHGPFSHQFDDTVYHTMGLKRGHDDYREKLILEILHKQMEQLLQLKPKAFRDQFYRHMEYIGFSPKPSSIEELMHEVFNVLEGKDKDGYSVMFNMVQGPIGADRMDFLLRDVYYSGVRGVGFVDYQRIIRHTARRTYKGKEVIAYHKKNIDMISSFLFTRYMMYKHVYFHKTSRAADIMIQELLELAADILKLPEKVKDTDEFMQLSDAYITEGIRFFYENRALLDEKSRAKVEKAYELLRRLESRDLYKPLLDTMKYFDESELTKKTIVDRKDMVKFEIQAFIGKIKENMENVLSSVGIEAEDRQELSDILEHFDEIFIADVPYYITVFDPREFTANDVFIYDTDKVWSLSEYLEEESEQPVLMHGVVYLLRVYLRKDIRNLLVKYNIIPSYGGDNVPSTLW
ncbi:HD domain-containing protein [bacterium 3DAC]|nr:HD domain-containing protein [bacterium 3DAC]